MSNLYLSITPAYGRDYTSKAAVLADWKGGKDFLVRDIHHGGYISIRDVETLKGCTLNIRYQKLTKVLSIKL